MAARTHPAHPIAGAFHRREGNARPAKVTDVRVSEINTQRFAAGSRGGTTAGQGPALDAK